MPNFALKKLEMINGSQDFFEMIIDGTSQFEQFISSVKTDDRYKSEIKTILAYMDFVANLKTLPMTKFKDITPAKADVKEYEFKSKHLRVYTFHLSGTGKIVTLWGFKKNQKTDITKFRSLKTRFLQNYTS